MSSLHSDAWFGIYNISILSELHGGNSSVSEPHSHNVNVSEAHNL